MGSGDLNFKKSWHPALMKNQKIVWEREQEAIAERKLIAERQKEIQRERERNELLAMQEAATGKKRVQRMEWMYSSASSGSLGATDEAEAYLLGKKRIDDLFTEETDRVKKDLIGERFVSERPETSKDMAKKDMEDPMMAIKKVQVQAAIAQMKDKSKTSNSERDSRSRSSRHRDDSRERSSHHRSSHREKSSRYRDSSRERSRRYRNSSRERSSRHRDTSKDRSEPSRRHKEFSSDRPGRSRDISTSDQYDRYAEYRSSHRHSSDRYHSSRHDYKHRDRSYERSYNSRERSHSPVSKKAFSVNRGSSEDARLRLKEMQDNAKVVNESRKERLEESEKLQRTLSKRGEHERGSGQFTASKFIK